jgi:hypothetical protein
MTVIYPGVQPEQWLTTLGELSISEHWVQTPTGVHPLRGTTWTVTDRTYWQTRVSSIGIVIVTLGVLFCLIGLLGLLLRDRHLCGYVEVTVRGDGFCHSTMVPADGPNTVWNVDRWVNYARTLSAAV